MRILVDADACPVVKIVERIAKQDDFAILNACTKDDIVVTQDYGVAAMILGKGAKGIHQNGRWYTNENIDQLLMERHLAKKTRKSSKNHLKGLQNARKRMMSGLRKVWQDW